MDLYLVILGTLLAAICVWKTFGLIQKYKSFVRLYYDVRVQPIGQFHPIWGHTHLFGDFAQFFRLCDKVIDKSKKRFVSFWVMCFFPSVGVCHPDSVKTLLKSLEPKGKKMGGAYFTIFPWIGDGLLISDGKKWERNRRLLTPAFHFDILKPYVFLYNKVFDCFLDKMDDATSGGRSVEIYEPVGLATLDTMLRCSFSYDGEVQQKGSSHPYVNAVRKLSYLSIQRYMHPWQFLDLLFYISPAGRAFSGYTKYVHDFDEKVIQERKKALAADPSVLTKRRLDFMDILLTAKDEHGEGLTDREVRDEVDTFLFEGEIMTGATCGAGDAHSSGTPAIAFGFCEGHDTTASAISWAIYALAKYPEEQQKVYEEVKSVLGDKHYVEWSDIQEFSRLSLFLKEVLRMFSPVPVITRVTSREMDIDGVTIPANTEVLILIHTLNNRDDIWTNPKEFRPDRFIGDSDRDPYTYVPFSAGPRNCIGQHFALNEQKVAIARLVQRFRVLPDPDHVPIMHQEVVMRSTNGIRVKLERR